MNTCESEFNRIVSNEILPLIPKAFLALTCDLHGTRLRCLGEPKVDIMQNKAHQLKAILNKYIDAQVDASIGILKD